VQLTLNNSSGPCPAPTQKGVVLLVMLTILILGSSYLFMRKLNSQSNTSKQNQQTSNRLNMIHDALLGYALTNGRLPCPDTDNDGLQNGPACNGVEGTVPGTDLGVLFLDAWGHPIRYRADDNFTAAIPSGPNPSSGLSIEALNGTLLSLASPDAPTAILFSCGVDGVPNNKNDANGIVNNNATCTNPGTADNSYIKDTAQTNFDDQLIWMTKAQLQARMTASGNWP
jgi:type II secretory pathway pseudopilin PulG